MNAERLASQTLEPDTSTFVVSIILTIGGDQSADKRRRAIMLALCATISFTLLGCGEPIHSVKRSTFVKICPHLRTFYSLQNKLYLKEGNNYQEVERHGDDVCNDQIAQL
jgi:hypothetical protein